MPQPLPHKPASTGGPGSTNDGGRRNPFRTLSHLTPCWGKLHPPGQQTGLKVSTGRSLHSRPEEIAELPGGMRPEVTSSSHRNRLSSSPDPLQILRQDALDHQQGDLRRPLLAGRRGARCRESIVVQPLFENTCKGYRYKNWCAAIAGCATTGFSARFRRVQKNRGAESCLIPDFCSGAAGELRDGTKKSAQPIAPCNCVQHFHPTL